MNTKRLVVVAAMGLALGGLCSGPFGRDRARDDRGRHGIDVQARHHRHDLTRGLVGRVSQVFPRSAEVLLISNKSISVSCVNRRSCVVGILEWDRSNLFHLEYVGKEEDVTAGDTLLPSGYGGLFPRGFLVGTVFQVADDRGGIAKRVGVASLANLNALEELFIVTGTRGWRDDRLYDELEKLEARGGGRR